ncbi:MAG: sigma-54 dependent transcriptional regulator [Methylococcales bacterium]|nr:sigma-54 dependent transcriptional regulator [Methylococcales bacterium]
MINTLLIIEDEKLLGLELSSHYKQLGWEVVLSATLAQAKECLISKEIEPLLILSDMNLPDGNALDFMEKNKKQTSIAEWVFLTGFGNVPDSVRALRLGAYDFLEKPCDLDHLDLIVASAARSATMRRRVIDETKQGFRKYSPEAFVGQSTAAQDVRKLLMRLTQVPFSALIIGGETGTGKGLIARILHYGGSRALQPMIEVNCAALPRELLESELFGHEAGAFTGATGRHRGLLEQADGGTLFMDELGEMPLELQAKLLKVIEDHKVRRLGSIHLPPLREAVDDLDELVPLFVAEYNAKAGRQVKQIPPEVWKKLKSHDWRGNVRELRNVIERCVLFADSSLFPVQWLQLGKTVDNTLYTADTTHIHLPLDGRMPLEDMDKFIIKTALERADNNLMAAARALGTTRETLRYRVKKYQLNCVDG